MRRRRIIGPGFPYLVTPVSAGAPPPIGDITSNLIGWWPMDDGHVSGPTLNEVSGRGGGPLNATVTGTIISSAGPGGLLTTARQTDGASVAVYTGATLFDWNSGSYTVAGWFYLSDITTASRSWADERVSDASNIMLLINDPNNHRLIFDISGQNTYKPTSASTYNANEWHHFAGVNVGGGASGTVKYFLDGTQITALTIGTGGSSLAMIACFFAADASLTTPMPSGSRLCGMRAYSRALADADIAYLVSQKT